MSELLQGLIQIAYGIGAFVAAVAVVGVLCVLAWIASESVSYVVNLAISTVYSVGLAFLLWQGGHWNSPQILRLAGVVIIVFFLASVMNVYANRNNPRRGGANV